MYPKSAEEKFGLTFYDTLGGEKGAAAVGSRNGDVKNNNSEVPPGQSRSTCQCAGSGSAGADFRGGGG